MRKRRSRAQVIFYDKSMTASDRCWEWTVKIRDGRPVQRAIDYECSFSSGLKNIMMMDWIHSISVEKKWRGGWTGGQQKTELVSLSTSEMNVERRLIFEITPTKISAYQIIIVNSSVRLSFHTSREKERRYERRLLDFRTRALWCLMQDRTFQPLQ